MHNLSMAQALDVWSDLEAAYHGKNGFGGDTAEIYLYRIMQRSPMYEAARQGHGGTTAKQEHDAIVRAANRSLYNLLDYFGKQKEDIKIFVNDRRLGTWLAVADLDHRVHVRIERKKT